MSKDGDQGDFKSRLQKLRDQEPPPLPSGNTSDSALQYRIDTLRGVPEEYCGKPAFHPSVYSGVHAQSIPDDFDITMQQIAEGGPIHSSASSGGGVGYLGGFEDPLLASVADASSFIGQNRTLQANSPHQHPPQRAYHPSQPKSSTHERGDTTSMGTGRGTGLGSGAGVEDNEEAYLDRILYGEKVPHVKPPSPVSAFRKTGKSGKPFGRVAGPDMGVSTSSSLSSQQRRQNIQHERKRYSHNVQRLIQEIETCQDDVVNIYKNVHDIRKKEEQKLRQLYGDEQYESMMKAIAKQRHEAEGDAVTDSNERQDIDTGSRVKRAEKGEMRRGMECNTKERSVPEQIQRQQPILPPSPHQVSVLPSQPLPQHLLVGQQQQLPPTLEQQYARDNEEVIVDSDNVVDEVVESDDDAVSVSDEEGNVRLYDNKGRVISRDQRHPQQHGQQPRIVPSSSSSSAPIALSQEQKTLASKISTSKEERNAFEYALAGIDDLIYEGNDISTLMQMAQDAAKLEDFDAKQRRERMEMEREEERRQVLRDLERLQKEEEREKKRYEMYIQEKERQEREARERKIREQELSRLSDESYRRAQQQQLSASHQLSPQSEGGGNDYKYAMTGMTTGMGTGARPQWDASKSVPVDLSRKNRNLEKNEIRENLSREIDAESANPDIIGSLFRIPEHLQPHVISPVDDAGAVTDINDVDRIIEQEMRKKKLKGRKQELEEEDEVGESTTMESIGKDVNRAARESDRAGGKDIEGAQQEKRNKAEEQEGVERENANGKEGEDVETVEDEEDVEALALESLLSEDRGFGWGTSHLSPPHTASAYPAAREADVRRLGAGHEPSPDTRPGAGTTPDAGEVGAMSTSAARIVDDSRLPRADSSGTSGAGTSTGIGAGNGGDHGGSAAGLDIEASLAYLTAHATPPASASGPTSALSTGVPLSALTSSHSSSLALPSSRASSASASLYPTITPTTTTTPPPVASLPQQSVKKNNAAWKSPPHWQKDLDEDEILSFFDDL